jgi:diacylglycerol kinase
MERDNFLSARFKSFGYALQGIRSFFIEEPNAWLHFAATILVVIMTILFPVTSTEATLLAIATGIVWIAEAFNTVIERTMDLVSPAKSPKVALIKDVSAGAVLLAAITAAVVGCIIFIPKIF